MTYADSAAVGATLTLHGVWLHDPADPDGTIQGYSYGGAVGQVQRDRTQELTYFAGREFPVADIGPYRSEVAQAVVHVPFDSDWQANLTRLRAIPEAGLAWQYRDGRGRSMRATLSGMMERDERWGTVVSFTAVHVDGVA